nr:hypothetical protein [bacterium]
MTAPAGERDRFTRIFSGLVLLGIAAVAVWPLPLSLHSTLPTVSTYSVDPADSDPAMFCWNLWWTAGWLEGRHPLLFCRILHHPFGISLARHTLSTANGITAWPLTRTLGPVPAHNILLILHALFTTAAAYRLSRIFNTGRWASVIAALIFTWWPARIIHAACHLNLASTGWLVLSLYLLAHAIRRDRPRRTAAAGLAAAVCGACSWHLFMGLFFLAPVIALTVPDPEHHPVSSMKRVACSTAALGIAIILLLPLLIPLLQPDPDLPIRSRMEKEAYSIPPIRHLIPSEQSSVFGNYIREKTAGPGGNRIETTGYVGLSIIFLSIAALVSGSRTDRRLLAGAALLLLLSWGPTLKIGSLHLPLPYRLLDMVPGLSTGRTPGRFVIPAGLLLALIAGRSLHQQSRRFPLFTAVMATLAAVEFCPAPMELIRFTELPVWRAAVTLAEDSSGSALLPVPNDWTNRSYMLAQTVHQRPITTGFTARMPRTVFQRIDGIPWLKALSSPGAESLDTLAELTRSIPDSASGSGHAADLIRLRDLLDVTEIVTITGETVDLTGLDTIPGIGIESPESYLLDRWSGPEYWGDPPGAVHWGEWPEARV